MYKLCRLARGRNPIIPAPRGVQFRVKFEHAVSDRVPMMVVEEEPPVEAAGAELLLDFG